MNRRVLDEKLKALETLRADPQSPATLEALRKALRDRSSFLVARAAKLGAEFQIRELIPDLIAAFDRFLLNPAKTDPQCWAKNAIVAALRALRAEDTAVFLRGIAHFQPEPVWGGVEDTAAALRGACALALVDCQTVAITAVVPRLVDLLADPEKPARIDAVRALAASGRPEAALLLRLKVHAGDREVEVIGECFSALLALDLHDALGFVARFLDAEERDLRFEAAGALGESRCPEAVELLRTRWEAERDSELRDAILIALGASRQPAAADFLIGLIAANHREAARALAALGTFRGSEQVRQRIAEAVESTANPTLAEAFRSEFGN